MKICFDTDALYELLENDVVGGMEAMAIDRCDDDAMSWKGMPASGAKAKHVIVGRGFVVPSTPMPMPWGSMDGKLIRTGDNYCAIVDFNDPELCQEVSPATSMTRMEKVHGCYLAIPAKLAELYADRYVKMGDGINGYLLDGGEQPQIAIQRLTRENAGFLRFRAGGPGNSRLVLTSPENFKRTMKGLEIVVNQVANAGIEEAVKHKLIESNPEIMLRFGPIA